jgi:hypothetical protein
MILTNSHLLVNKNPNKWPEHWASTWIHTWRVKTTLETSGEDVRNTLETSGEDVRTTLETSGEDVKTTLETSGEDLKLHSKRVEKMKNYTRNEWRRYQVKHLTLKRNKELSL